MPNKRKLVDKSIINFRFVLLHNTLCVIFSAYAYLQLRNLPPYFTIPLMFGVAFTLWQFIYIILFNIVYSFKKNYSAFETNNGIFISEKPEIAFIIPSYHEPFEVAKLTFDSVIKLPYKGQKNVIVVDNSNDINSDDFNKWKLYVEQFNDYDPNLKVNFIYNENKEGLKPGNLDLGQKYIKNSEYVVFLDIDSTLPFTKEILEKSIAKFSHDPSLGWIQFLTLSTNDHLNKCSQIASVYENMIRINAFFRSKGGFTLFYGHNGIWRKECLLKLGSWVEKHKNQIMVTEDLLKSVKAYEQNYYGISIPVKTGEWVPNSLNAMESMWQRWAYGTCQVVAKYFKTIIANKKMTFYEKYDLLHTVFHYCGHAFIVPLNIVYLTLLKPEQSWMIVLFLNVFPNFFGALAVYRHSLRHQTLSWIKKLWQAYAGAFIMGSFVTIVQFKGVFNYFMNIKQGWKVTAKGVENSESYFSVLMKNKLYIFIASLLLAASFISWAMYFNWNTNGLIYYLPMLILPVNLMLCVLIYGKTNAIKLYDLEKCCAIEPFNQPNTEHAAAKLLHEPKEEITIV